MVGLGLGRQLGRDPRVGLAAPEEEGPHHLREAFGGLGIAVALDGGGHVAAERLQRAEQARGRPVEDRPQLGQTGSRPVCRSGRRGRRPGRPRAHGPCATRGSWRAGPRRRRPGPTRRRPAPGGRDARPRRWPARRRRVEVVEVAPAAVEPAHRDPRGEAAQLPLPVAEQGGRADDQGGRPRPAGQVQGDHLHRLAEAHVVGQAPADAELGHLEQPGQAPDVGRGGGWPRAIPVARPSVVPPVTRCRRPASSASGPSRVEGDPFAVDVDLAGEGGRASAPVGAEPAGPAAAKPSEQGGVDGHPAAPDPHEWAFGLGQRGQSPRS